MRARHPRRLGTLAVFATLLLVAQAAFADYKQAYKNGIKASDRKDWAGVARFMQQAIAEQPQESAEKLNIYGMRYEAYLPHYYLGIALKENGDCKGALQELAVSEQQGVVQRTESHGNLTQARDACRQQLPAVPPTQPTIAPTAPPTAAPVPVNLGPAIQKAEKEIGLATDAANGLGALRQNPDYAAVWQATPELIARAEAAGRKLDQARSKLILGRTQSNVGELDSAAGLATDANRELAALKNLAITRHNELVAESRKVEEERKQTLVREINTKLAEARGVQGQAAARQPATADVQRQSVELGRAIADTGNLGTLTVAQLEALQGRLTSATAVLKDTLSRPVATVAGGPPAELRQAVELYLGAEWNRLAQYLGSLTLGEPKADAAVALLRGVARYSLYVEGGEKNAALRQQAEADIRTCRRLSAAVVPTAKAFSPRFVDFFQRVR